METFAGNTAATRNLLPRLPFGTMTESFMQCIEYTERFVMNDAV